MEQAEHILLESDVNREVPTLNRAKKTPAALLCQSRLRRCRIELAIIDDYYLAVRTGRVGSLREYILDLRFADPSIHFTKHVPKRLIGAASAIGLLAALSAWRAFSSTSTWYHAWLAICAATTVSTLCLSLLCVWRMTETFALYSLHGRATLLTYTGGPGTLRAVQKVGRKLASHIQLAIARRRSSKAEYLRDEMREHFRLKEAGVLQEEMYETSKARILAQHAPVTRSPRAISTT
jgi:hypothetical protein